jgi:hypothetical protein
MQRLLCFCENKAREARTRRKQSKELLQVSMPQESQLHAMSASAKVVVMLEQPCTAG